MRRSIRIAIRRLLLAATLTLLIGCTLKNTAPRYVTVKPAPAVPVLKLEGIVTAPAARLSFSKDGNITVLLVERGDTVNTGDTLAIIDNSEDKNTLAKYKAELAIEQLNLRKLTTSHREIAEQQVIQARLEEEAAGKLTERKRNMLVQGTIPQTEFDEVAKAYARCQSVRIVAESELASLMSTEVEIAKQKILQAELRCEEISNRLAQTILRAPFSGVVTHLQAYPGSFCKTGEAIIELSKLANDRSLAVMLLLGNNHFDLKQGQRVRIRRISGVQPTVTATVRSFRNLAHAVNRTVETVLIPDSTAAFPSETRVLVEIHGDTLTDALVIDPAFVTITGTRTSVTVRHGVHYEKVDILSGYDADGRIIVYQGIVPGDTLMETLP